MSPLTKDSKKNLIIGMAGMLLCALAQAFGHPEISKIIEIGQDVYDLAQIVAAIMTGVGSLATIYAAVGLAAKYIPLAITYTKEKYHQLMASRPMTYIKDKFRQLFGRKNKEEGMMTVVLTDQQQQASNEQSTIERSSNQTQYKKDWRHTLIGRLLLRHFFENRAERTR